MTARLLKRPEVQHRTALSRSNLYSLIQKGEFPRQIKLTQNGRAVGWLESDIDAWLEKRIAESNSKEIV